VSEEKEPAGAQAEARATANRLRVGLSAFRRRTHEAAINGDLTAPQLTALSRLDRLGPLTTAELARREQITPQAMGATIASLEQRGLVARSADAADARRSILSLTPAGTDAIHSGRSALSDKIAAALARSFTSDEIAVLDAAAPLIERLSELLLPPSQHLETLMPASSSEATLSGPASGTAGESPFSWQFTTPLFIGSALNPVNSSLIATALLPIAHGLGVPLGQTTALVTALYLASAIAQPTAGKAAEVFGPRRVFIAGIIGVAIGGLVGGFAQDLLTLLVSRVLIGLGTSCAYPTAMLLIRHRARDAGLDKPPGGVLGGLQIAGTATASLGLPVGGILVGSLGWRSVFFINVPVALIALVTTLAWVPADGPLPRPLRARDVASRLDLAGIAGFAAAMIALLLFLFGLPTLHWYLLAISLVLWAALVLWELRAATPFLDIRLLVSNKALTSTYLRLGLLLLCVYLVLYGITQWIEAVRGLNETEAGLVLLPMTLVTGLVVAPVSRRNLVRGPIIAAAFTCLIASAGLLLLTGTVSIAVIVIITIIFGVAMGFGVSGNQTALYSQAPPEHLGTASGLSRTFGYVGSIASSAITGVVFHTSVTNSGVHLIAWIMIGVSVVLVALSVADRTLRAKTPTS
jgi:MFS family permease/DNA-binding MarR family transcriptional regulator